MRLRLRLQILVLSGCTRRSSSSGSREGQEQVVAG